MIRLSPPLLPPSFCPEQLSWIFFHILSYSLTCSFFIFLPFSFSKFFPLCFLCALSTFLHFPADHTIPHSSPFVSSILCTDSCWQSRTFVATSSEFRGSQSSDQKTSAGVVLGSPFTLCAAGSSELGEARARSPKHKFSQN